MILKNQDRAGVVEERTKSKHQRHDIATSVPKVCAEDRQELHAEERQEGFSAPPLGIRVELGGPGRNREPGQEEAQRVQDRPVMPPCQEQRAAHEYRVVAEERDLRVLTAAYQERRCEPASNRHDRQAKRLLSIRQPGGARRNSDEEDERRRLSDQPVVAERGIDRQEQRRNTTARDDLPVSAIAATRESVARERKSEPDNDAESDAHRLGDPVVVEGMLQEECDAEDQNNCANPQHQTSADGFFQALRRRRGRFCRRGVWGMTVFGR